MNHNDVACLLRIIDFDTAQYLLEKYNISVVFYIKSPLQQIRMIEEMPPRKFAKLQKEIQKMQNACSTTASRREFGETVKAYRKLINDVVQYYVSIVGMNYRDVVKSPGGLSNSDFYRLLHYLTQDMYYRVWEKFDFVNIDLYRCISGIQLAFKALHLCHMIPTPRRLQDVQKSAEWAVNLEKEARNVIFNRLATVKKVSSSIKTLELNGIIDEQKVLVLSCIGLHHSWWTSNYRIKYSLDTASDLSLKMLENVTQILVE